MQIAEIELLSQDLTRARSFYHEVMGLPVVSFEKHKISFRAGASLLSFCATAKEVPPYHLAFNIPPDQIEEALVWARPRLHLLPVKEGEYIADFKHWNSKALYFFDADGNIVELIARGDWGIPTGERFTARSILCISEMGMVTDDVETKARQLSRQFSIPYFSRQAPSPEFTVLGDDNGLLILVPTGRNWYPTQIAASRGEAKVLVQIDGTLTTLIM